MRTIYVYHYYYEGHACMIMHHIDMHIAKSLTLHAARAYAIFSMC